MGVEATEMAGLASRTGLRWQPQRARNQPALQSHKPECAIGKTQEQGAFSSQPLGRVDTGSPGPGGTQATVSIPPWALVSWMSRLMVSLPQRPTCLDSLKGRHRGPQGSPILMTFQWDTLSFDTLPSGDPDQPLCHVGP